MMLGSSEERIGPSSSAELKELVNDAGEVGHQILVCLSVASKFGCPLNFGCGVRENFFFRFEVSFVLFLII